MDGIPHLPSPVELLREAFLFYKTHWRAIVRVVGVTLPFLILGELYPENPFFLSLVLIFDLLVYSTLMAAMSQEGGFRRPLREMFRRGSEFVLPWLWISLLSSLVVGGGLVLFVIPAVALAVYLSTANFTLYAEGYRGLSALTRSSEYVRGRWLLVAVRSLFTLVMSAVITLFEKIPGFAGSLATSLIQMFTTPLFVAYGFYLYGALRDTYRPSLVTRHDEQLVKIFRALTMLGVVMFIVVGGIVTWTLLG